MRDGNKNADTKIQLTPSRQAIAAAEKDTFDRHMKKPIGKFFVGANDLLVRKFNARAAGAAAALTEARNQIKNNNAQDLDDTYLSELVEAEAQRAERAKLYKENKPGKIYNRTIAITGATLLTGLALMLASSGIGMFVVGFLIYASSLPVMGAGLGVFHYKSSKLDKASNKIGETAKQEFEKLRANGKSQIEALDIASNKQLIVTAVQNKPDDVTNIANQQSATPPTQNPQQESTELLEEVLNQTIDLPVKSNQEPPIAGGKLEKELQRRSLTSETPPIHQK